MERKAATYRLAGFLYLYGHTRSFFFFFSFMPLLWRLWKTLTRSQWEMGVRRKKKIGEVVKSNKIEEWWLHVMTCHLHAEREPEAHSAQAGPFQSQTINCWANYKLRAGRARRRLTPTPFSFKPSDDNNIAPPGPPLFGRQTPPFAATSIFFWGSPKQQLIQHFRQSAASGKKKIRLNHINLRMYLWESM